MPKIKYEVSSQKENFSLDQSDFRDFNPALQYKSARGSFISHFPFKFQLRRRSLCCQLWKLYWAGPVGEENSLPNPNPPLPRYRRRVLSTVRHSICKWVSFRSSSSHATEKKSISWIESKGLFSGQAKTNTRAYHCPTIALWCQG